MKYLFILFISLFAVKSVAQNTVDLYSADVSLTNTYFKDINGILTPFVGTWVYENGTTSLTFVIQKATMHQIGSNHYDLLYGEIRYVENGVEKFNTLAEIGTAYPSQYSHTISGDHILHYGDLPTFNKGNPGDIRVILYINDPITNSVYRAFLRQTQAISVNGNPIVSVLLKNDGLTSGPPNPEPVIDMLGLPQVFVGQTIPNGTYEMEKQP